jgi:hypothetical protein
MRGMGLLSHDDFVDRLGAAIGAQNVVDRIVSGLSADATQRARIEAALAIMANVGMGAAGYESIALAIGIERSARTKMAHDKLDEERARKIAVIEDAMARKKRWDQRLILVNEAQGRDRYETPESLRVSYIRLTKTAAKKGVMTDSRYKKVRET